MIEAWLAQRAVRIAILVAALLFPFAAVGCTVETVKLHGIAFHLPLFGEIELAHGALADTRAAQAARDQALQDLGRARANEATLQAGVKTCNDSVERLKSAGDEARHAAQAATDRAAAADAKARAAAVAAMNRIESSAETCPVADAIIRGALQ